MRGLIVAALAGAGAAFLSGCSPDASARLYQLGSIMRDSPDGAPTPVSAAPSAGLTCFKRGDVVSGLYRNCIYSCGAAGTVAKTIGAAELCPISLQ
jgi:hypothetical protein